MTALPPAPRARLVWFDVVKGVSILWIAFFHAFGTFTGNAYPSPLAPGYFTRFLDVCNPQSGPDTALCVAEGFMVGIARTGFHAVSVFFLLSGFGLTSGLLRKAATSARIHSTTPGPRLPTRNAASAPDGGWRRWYFKRLVRLFPMYWLAHLLYLFSPLVARPEPVDYRWLLSFFGDRVWPIESIFYYMNPALWYFGTLLQLYIVFPVLYGALRRLGAGWFLAASAAFTFGSRYLLLNVVPVHGYWVQGGFFGARLFEFAAGMALAAVHLEAPDLVARRLFSPAALLLGTATYTAGLYSYANNVGYVFTDALIGTGLFVLLAWLAKALERSQRIEFIAAHVGVYSYGLYLIHQPYVTYFAESARGMPMAAFVPLALALVALLAALSAPVERAVNRVMDAVTG